MRVRRPRRTLVLGGARSGKSSFAERLISRHGAVDYVACGSVPDADDSEWASRVALHRHRRPSHWKTVETLDVRGQLLSPGAPALIDCLSTWLARTMDECDIWSNASPGVAGGSGGSGSGSDVANRELADRVDALVAAWQATRRTTVVVSNEVGSGIVPATESGRRFRDELGILNARIAASADRVWLLTAGIPQRLR